ncbi:MAG TPA: Uma2 family endonuclease, partial [Gemmatimonadaceae bacterium]|nr:Uma2 family endonuclease [Gemmatimonadaceae bacterium]
IDMVMPAATPPPSSPVRWNRAMLEALPDDGQRHEIIDGVHHVTPSPAAIHQYVVSELLGALLPWCKAERAGWVFTAPSDIELTPDTIVQPDITVFPRTGERPPRTWSEGGRPILVVEVISPSSASRDRILKRRRYQRAEIAEYWIVDAESRLLERWRPADERPEIITDVLRWHPAGASSALAIDLAPIFAAID